MPITMTDAVNSTLNSDFSDRTNSPATDKDPSVFGKVAVVYGGNSNERAVSLDSGNAVLKALQSQGVEVSHFDPKDQDITELLKLRKDLNKRYTTTMNKDMIDLYTDYQLSSFGQTTATGLSAMMEGSISHDAVTRFLTNSEYTSKHLWQQVKPTIRDIENEDGVLIFDDTIQAKPHTKENETNCWHYDHTTNTTVKGINLLNCLYHCEGVSLPIAFHIVTKPICYSDISTRKTKRKATITKNQLLRDMVDTACHNQVKFRYVLMDSWFTSKQTLKHIRKKDKHVIAALKSNRLIALNLQDKK